MGGARLTLWATVAFILAVISAALLPVRVLPIDGPWLDAIHLPGLAWLLFPVFLVSWAVLSLLSMQRGQSVRAYQCAVLAALSVLWLVVPVAGSQLNQTLNDLSLYSRAQLGEPVVLDQGHFSSLPSPYTPPSQRPFWTAVSSLYDVRRFFGDDSAGDFELGTSRAERVNAQIGAGQEFSERLVAPAGNTDEKILYALVNAKAIYAGGDTTGAVNALLGAMKAAQQLDSPSRELATIEVRKRLVYYLAAQTTAAGDLTSATRQLQQYSRWVGAAATLSRISEDPAFKRLRQSAGYSAFVGSLGPR